MAKNSKKTSARRATTKTRARYVDNARIKVLVKENPTREGTSRFKNVARIMKHNGKTLAEFVKHGGKTASLSFAEQMGWIRVAAR